MLSVCFFSSATRQRVAEPCAALDRGVRAEFLEGQESCGDELVLPARAFQGSLRCRVALEVVPSPSRQHRRGVLPRPRSVLLFGIGEGGVHRRRLAHDICEGVAYHPRPVRGRGVHGREPHPVQGYLEAGQGDHCVDPRRRLFQGLRTALRRGEATPDTRALPADGETERRQELPPQPVPFGPGEHEHLPCRHLGVFPGGLGELLLRSPACPHQSDMAAASKHLVPIHRSAWKGNSAKFLPVPLVLRECVYGACPSSTRRIKSSTTRRYSSSSSR
jgi:hypothetical protein